MNQKAFFKEVRRFPANNKFLELSLDLCFFLALLHLQWRCSAVAEAVL